MNIATFFCMNFLLHFARQENYSIIFSHWYGFSWQELILDRVQASILILYPFQANSKGWNNSEVARKGQERPEWRGQHKTKKREPLGWFSAADVGVRAVKLLLSDTQHSPRYPELYGSTFATKPCVCAKENAISKWMLWKMQRKLMASLIICCAILLSFIS